MKNLRLPCYEQIKEGKEEKTLNIYVMSFCFIDNSNIRSNFSNHFEKTFRQKSGENLETINLILPSLISSSKQCIP